MNKVTDDKAGVSQEISNARLKYWLDFWKVIFGTAVVGFVTAIFGFVIDWRGKDLEDFKARSDFYNNPTFLYSLRQGRGDKADNILSVYSGYSDNVPARFHMPR